MSSATHLKIGFILHTRDYRETSLLLDVFTEEYGLISLISRGARRAKSKTKSLLSPFRKLNLSWLGHSELMTLVDVEEYEQRNIALQGVGLYCGFYINELILRFLHKYDPHPELFFDYESILNKITSNIGLQAALRIFEKRLLDHVGYGLILTTEAKADKKIQAEMCYHYDIENGPIICNGQNRLDVFQGKTLLALADEDLQDASTVKECKTLMRKVINYHLGNKPLKSRELLSNHF